MTRPKIAIVVVAYKAKEYLPDLCQSLAACKYPRDLRPIYFLDNASSGKTTFLIKKLCPDSTLIESKINLGFAGGNNKAVKQALADGADYIYLLNQDTIVDPNFLEAALQTMQENNNLAAVQSLLLQHPQTNQINSWGNNLHYLGFGSAGGYKELYEPQKLKEKSIAYASGAAVLIPTKVIGKIGLFDDGFFMYHEDIAFGLRARLAGYDIKLSPKSIVYHKFSFSKSIKKYYWMERNRWLVLWQYYRIPTLVLFIPMLFIQEIGSFPLAIISGWASQRLRVYCYFLSYSNWVELFKRRAQIQKLRKVSDRKISQILSSTIKYQEMKPWLLTYVGNPVMAAYFWVVKRLIWW